MKKVEATVTVIDIRRAGPRHFLMRFGSRELAKARPGQFVMIRTVDAIAPLLRRPLGVHAVGRGTVSVLFEAVGEATRILSGKRPGEKLGVIGPLGNGFTFPAGGSRPVLVAGGMGVAPLYFLASRMKGRGVKPLALIGARESAAVLREKEFRALGCGVKAATDDGSKGFRGYVTQLLEKELRPGDVVFACGPVPMLKEAARICAERAIPCQVSLEAHMSCGFGACMGCTVRTVSGYKRVCHDGPVFDAKEIEWQQK